MWLDVVFGLLGGMGLLLYGIYVLSAGLQKIAGHKLRHILSSVTQNRVMGLSVGAATTILFQSSTATTVVHPTKSVTHRETSIFRPSLGPPQK